MGGTPFFAFFIVVSFLGLALKVLISSAKKHHFLVSQMSIAYIYDGVAVLLSLKWTGDALKASQSFFLWLGTQSSRRGGIA